MLRKVLKSLRCPKMSIVPLSCVLVGEKELINKDENVKTELQGNLPVWYKIISFIRVGKQRQRVRITLIVNDTWCILRSIDVRRVCLIYLLDVR